MNWQLRGPVFPFIATTSSEKLNTYGKVAEFVVVQYVSMLKLDEVTRLYARTRAQPIENGMFCECCDASSKGS